MGISIFFDRVSPTLVKKRNSLSPILPKGEEGEAGALESFSEESDKLGSNSINQNSFKKTNAKASVVFAPSPFGEAGERLFFYF